MTTKPGAPRVASRDVSSGTSRRALVLVLDGLGIGAMADVAATRPTDVAADTLVRVRSARELSLPNLDRLGLGAAAAVREAAPPTVAGGAWWGRGNLSYHGADSYLGHLELMGGDLSGIPLERFAVALDRYAAAFRAAGLDAQPVVGGGALLVSGAMLVGDSLEADPGLNYNVTGCLPLVPWTAILDVATQLRAMAPVSRVIAVGGAAIGRDELLAAVHTRDGATGVDTAELGVYMTGVEIRHLGAPIDTHGLLHVAAAAAGRFVLLVGKAADLLPGDGMERASTVSTDEIFGIVLSALREGRHDLLVATVQQTDLAGHQEDAAWFGELLERCDLAIGRILGALAPDDLLIVTSDHGNDPGFGPHHTRELVPILAHSGSVAGGPIGDRSTLADVGATVAAWLDLGPTTAGSPFVPRGTASLSSAEHHIAKEVQA